MKKIYIATAVVVVLLVLAVVVSDADAKACNEAGCDGGFACNGPGCDKQMNMFGDVQFVPVIFLDSGCVEIDGQVYCPAGNDSDGGVEDDCATCKDCEECPDCPECADVKIDENESDD